MRVLVINAGSSSLKGWERPDVVGHRIVHGGTRFAGPARIDDDVRERLGQLTALAPLHQPKSLAALDAVTALLPDVLATASFDTAFHTTIPAAASTYAIPREWRDRHAIHRYGFHGRSHTYCSRRAADLLGRRVEDLRIVTCHLGAGASLTAVAGGRSVDTTMGFTPLEGLVMATRTGTVDPGPVLWLQEQRQLSPHEVSTALAGTGDMRAIVAAAARKEPAASLALDVYVHRPAGGIAAMCAALGGMDMLAFTGGVGEHSPTVRQRAVEPLGFLGADIDARRNTAVQGDGDITATGATVATVVITAREDLQIAREARTLLGAPSGAGRR